MGAFKLNYRDYFYCTKKCNKANHLGNVLTVFTDKKIPVGTGTTVSYYKADLLSSMDYSPFGAPLKGRTFNGSGSRYGFNGKEKTSEIDAIGDDNTYDYGMRMNDVRLGRFLSVDPLKSSYPFYTPYQFAGNTPIAAIDVDGLEQHIVIKANDKTGTVLTTLSWSEIEKGVTHGSMGTGDVYYTVDVKTGKIIKQEYYKSFADVHPIRNWVNDADHSMVGVQGLETYKNGLKWGKAASVGVAVFNPIVGLMMFIGLDQIDNTLTLNDGISAVKEGRPRDAFGEFFDLTLGKAGVGVKDAPIGAGYDELVKEVWTNAATDLTYDKIKSFWQETVGESKNPSKKETEKPKKSEKPKNTPPIGRGEKKKETEGSHKSVRHL